MIVSSSPNKTHTLFVETDVPKINGLNKVKCNISIINLKNEKD
jgi:hypothetical protein